MLRRIDVRDIVRGHIETLTEYGTSRAHRGDYLLFFGVPLVMMAGLLWTQVLLTRDMANIIITSLSIFAGLLFNLLLLTHGMLRSVPQEKTVEKTLIREIYSNISFAILVSILIIITCTAFYFSARPWFVLSVTAVSHFLVANFALTLLMILRRIHILLSNEFNRA